MLILLPPSEGKTQPATGSACDLASLSFAEHLHRTRLAQWKAQPASVKRAAAGPAHEVYSGVLYAALDYASLKAAAQRRAENSIVVFSALFGAVRLTGEIPAYKATMSNAVWRTPLTAALSPLASSGVTVDCRSTTYAGAFTPPTNSTVAVRVFRQSGKMRTVITHMSKHYRGLIARMLCEAPRAAKSPEDVANLASATWTTELHRPTDKQPWLLDILVKE